LVLTGKVALLAPAGTVMLGGTVATFVSEDASARTRPPAGAFPIRKMVPVDGVPPTRLNGLKEMYWRMAGATVKDAVCVTPAYMAEIVTLADDVTPVVVTVKSANVAFAGTVTLGGVAATDALELESETTRPPAGAVVESETRPVTGRPPLMTVGDTDTEARADGRGVTVRVPYCEPVKYAVIRTFVVPTTGYVVTGKVPLGAPAGMVMLAGTVAADGLPLESVTSAPPAGARPLRMTVPVDGVPP
jgi:hypothetical protein